MNYKLLFAFLVSQVLEFGLFWIISIVISNYYEIEQLKLFLIICGIDLALTGFFCGGNVKDFFTILFKKED